MNCFDRVSHTIVFIYPFINSLSTLLEKSRVKL